MVFRMRVSSVDLRLPLVTSLAPLWSPLLPAERTEPLLRQVPRFVDPSGLRLSAIDAAIPLSDGQRAIWPYWTLLIVEGLIEAGQWAAASDLLTRLMRRQTEALRVDRAFQSMYPGEGATASGERASVSGFVPVHLLLRLLGVRVVSPKKVFAGGPFVWPQPVTVRQHGVVVSRSAQGTEVIFASGARRVLDVDAPLTELTDDLAH